MTATFRDPLSGRVTLVTVLERVRLSAGSRDLGDAFNVVDETGRHFTARPEHLRETQ